MQSNFSDKPNDIVGSLTKPLSVKDAMKLAKEKAQTKRNSSIGSAQDSLFVTAMDTNAKFKEAIQTVEI